MIFSRYWIDRTFLFSECRSYQALTTADRKITAGGSPRACDKTLGPGWFRFLGDAGNKMPTSCVPQYHCGTDAPGWLNGLHPSVAEGKVTRKVCFTWNSSCCRWAINIQVRNCGEYFIYYFSGTPKEHKCTLRYCGTS